MKVLAAVILGTMGAISADAQSPTVLALRDTTAVPGQTVGFDVVLERGAALVGLQLGLVVPAALSVPSCTLDARLVGYSLSTYAISASELQLVALNYASLAPGMTHGRLLRCTTRVQASALAGYYPFVAAPADVALDATGLFATTAVRIGGVRVAGSGVPSVSGHVTYAGTGKPVPGVVFDPYDDVQSRALSDRTGAYALRVGLPAVALEPTKRGGLGTALSALDATWIQQYVAGTRTFSQAQRYACDVSGNGSCTTTDANLVNQRIAGTLAAFPAATACDSDFLLWPSSPPLSGEVDVTPILRTGRCVRGLAVLDGVSGPVVERNWEGVAIGDVSQSWVDSGCAIQNPVARTSAWPIIAILIGVALARPLEDLANRQIGRLLVLRLFQRGSRHAGPRNPVWLCQCSCGTLKPIAGSSLRRGTTRSCGCLKLEGIGALNRHHGLSGTVAYRIWSDMWRRCEDAGRADYRHYGGRGIVVCERWLSFEHFLTDMGERPSPKHSIDRIDNDRGYEPDNCRWATHSEQRLNRRRIRKVLLTWNGVTTSLTEWAHHIGISPSTLSARIKKGWSHERLFQPRWSTANRGKRP